PEKTPEKESEAKAPARDEKLEAEAEGALRKAKGEADGLVSLDKFPEAIAIYGGFPEKYKGTGAWDRAAEEKDRVFNIAIGRLRAKIAEVEKRLQADRTADAKLLAAEVAAILDGIGKGWGGKPPEEITGLRESLEKQEKEIGSRLGDEAWLDEIEPRIKNLGPEEEAVLGKLKKLAKEGPPALKNRIARLIGELVAHREARDLMAEEARFKKARSHAQEMIDRGDANGAENLFIPFLKSKVESIRRTAAEEIGTVGELREALSRLDEARGRAETVTARGNFSDIERTRKVLEGFEGSEFKAIRDRAGEAIRRLDGVKASLLEGLRDKGYAVIAPYEGEVGSDDPSDGNKKRTVKLGRFAIGLHEVSCAEYAEFLGESGRTPPRNWRNGAYPEGWGEHPVTWVTAADAEAYCAWLAEKTGLPARLPYEEEWEVAAGWEPPPGGDRISTFPWGNDFEAGSANLDGGEPKEVGGFEKDKSPAGVFDMAGNVCEWTVCRDDPSGRPFAIRGGCFDDDGEARSARTTFRQVMPPTIKTRRLGFRVAVELE
ncbi:MAG: formylglycine-generating enzyme family protein, partial [Planctomycetota bacterium]